MADAGSGEAERHQTFEVELVPVTAAGGEKSFVFEVLIQEPVTKAGIDLVAGPGDARPDRGADMIAAGAECLHRRDGGAGNVAQRPLPPRMGGTDDAGRSVGEQDRRAIGSKDTERQAGGGSDHRIGVRPPGVGERRRDGHDRDAMDLVQRHQRRPRRNGFDNTVAVLGHGRAVIGRPEPDVEAGEDTARHPAAPPGETVADTEPGSDEIDRHSVNRHRISASSWSPTLKA